MELPVYQARALPPQTSGLNPANPGIAGGGAITQGLSNVASGLLVLAAQEQQQIQADQISTAGRIFGTISESMDAKAQELRNRQAETPMNPRLVGQEFRDYTHQLVEETLKSPEVASVPFMSKYLATHLPQALHSRTQAFDTYTNETWQQWDQFETATALQGMRESAVKDPSSESAMYRQAQALLRGKAMAGTLTGEQAAKAWQGFTSSVSYGRGLLFAKSHAQSWVDATTRGTFPEGFDVSLYTPEQIKEFDTVAKDTYTLFTTQASADETAYRRNLTDLYESRKGEWLSRYLPHQDATGTARPAEPTAKILAELTTQAARQELGPQWDSVHSFYHAYDLHQQSAGGAKPSPARYNHVLTGIYTGRLTTSMAVLKEAAGFNFDIPSTNEVLGKFETERGHLDKATQQRITQSIEVIRGKFAQPGGAALDPADMLGRMNTVLTRHFLWLEGLRAKGGTALAEADLIGTAQKLADQEYRNVAEYVISIVPRTEASLIYKTPEEAKTAALNGEITERELNSRLQEIEQFRQLQQITGDKTPKLSQGRSEAFR